MGEEQKEAENNEQEAKKEEEEPQEVVLRVDMHCEGCARKVEKSLKKFEGVEDVKADSRSKTVVAKGKPAAADPLKVCEWVQKKTRKRVELISPVPKPPEEEKKEENQEAQQEKKEEEPKAITVILKMKMHCEACAQVLQKRIRKIEGVESVETDLVNEQVIVKGIVDPNVLVESVYKKTKKQASIVQEEEKKEEEKPQEEENKEGDNVDDLRKYEYWPFHHYVEYAYPPPPQMYTPPTYAYPPQMFSDENPHSCSVM